MLTIEVERLPWGMPLEWRYSIPWEGRREEGRGEEGEGKVKEKRR